MREINIDYYKKAYPKGTRIELDSMEDDPNPILQGTQGEVDYVDDIGTVHCRFDNGRCLGICPEVDRFHKLR